MPERLFELLDCTFIELDELEEVMESEYVIEVEDCGMSGIYYGSHYYIAHLINGDSYDLYVR